MAAPSIYLHSGSKILYFEGTELNDVMTLSRVISQNLGDRLVAAITSKRPNGTVAYSVSAVFPFSEVTGVVMDGKDGNDILSALTPKPATLSGGDGNDQVLGGSGADSLSGGYGDDVIDGGAGSDTIAGGPGVDHITAGDGNDSVTGGGGGDWIYGMAGDDTLVGGTGFDVIVDNQGNNKITQ